MAKAAAKAHQRNVMRLFQYEQVSPRLYRIPWERNQPWRFQHLIFHLGSEL